MFVTQKQQQISGQKLYYRQNPLQSLVKARQYFHDVALVRIPELQIPSPQNRINQASYHLRPGVEFIRSMSPTTLGEINQPMSFHSTQKNSKHLESSFSKAVNNLQTPLNTSIAETLAVVTQENSPRGRFPDLNLEKQGIVPNKKLHRSNKFSCSDLFQLRIQQTNDNEENIKAMPKRKVARRPKNQADVYIGSYIQILQKHNPVKSNPTAILKLMEDLKPEELPTLSQMAQKNLDEKHMKNQQHQKKSQLSSFLYDMIYDKMQISFDQLVYQFLDAKEISRGFLEKPPETIISQFFQYLEIARKLFNSDKLLTQCLAKTPGMDLKLLTILFKKKDNIEYDEKQILQILEDSNFYDHFQLRNDVGVQEVVMRVICGFDLPEEIFNNLMELVRSNCHFNHNLIAFRQSVHRKIQKDLYAKYGSGELIKRNITSLDLDVDLLKRLVYFSNNFQGAINVKMIYSKIDEGIESS